MLYHVNQFTSQCGVTSMEKLVDSSGTKFDTHPTKNVSEVNPSSHNRDPE